MSFCERFAALTLFAAMLLAAPAANAGQAADSVAPQTTAPAAAHVNNARPTITFAFVRDVAGAPVPRYTLTIRNNGAGSYAGEAVPPPAHYGPPASSVPVPFQRELRLTSATTARIFDLAAQLDHFNRTCASKAKNIADTGAKTISYVGPDGSGSCTYNYTEIKDLAALTQMVQGIAETLDRGRELDRLHQYDRLGLDAAMAFLAQEAAAGRALELETIGDTLRSIAEDAEVLARVRAKASALLTQAGAAE